MDLNDEILCAYIDGELDREMRRRVEESLASDPGACARLERMQNADVNVRNAFPMPAVKPDDTLVEHIAKDAGVSRGALRFTIRRGAIWGAIAAGVSGIVLGYLLPKAADRLDGTLLAFASKDALATALETQASGRTTTENTTSIEVQLTFKADDGRYCRVFRLQTDRESAEAIACRDNRRWKVLALDTTSPNGGGFRAAGASELIDGVMDHLGGSAPLERKQEQTVIEQHWQVNAEAHR